MRACCAVCGTTNPVPTMGGDDEEQFQIFWFKLSKDLDGSVHPVFTGINAAGELDCCFLACTAKEMEITEEDYVVCPDCLPPIEEEDLLNPSM